MSGTLVSAGIVSGDLILGLSDGSIVNAGRVQGPQGLSGPQGPMGPIGRAGIDGNTILSSDGYPSPDQGKEGDWIIDKVHWEIYGPKAGDNSSWGKGQPLLASRANAKSEVTHSDRWKAGGGRFFPMGAASGAISVPPATTAGLDPIIGHNSALAASIKSKVAFDAAGDSFHCVIKADAAGGSWYGEVAVTHFGTIAAYTIAWEIPIGTAPVLTFDTDVTGGELNLYVTSDVTLTKIRGRVEYI